MIEFPKYGPDVKGGLEVCDGLLPYNGKYYPLPSLEALTTNPVQGSALNLQVFQDSSRNFHTFAGCTQKLYRYDGTFPTDVSKSGGYATPTTASWNFALYGTTGLATNHTSAIQKISNITTGAFADLGGTPPLAKHIAMFKDQLFLGYTTEGGVKYPRRVFRSKQGDIETWAVDSATGCGFYDLPSWTQEITGMVVNGDYLFVYMNESIWMLTFIGPPLWYSYNKIYDGPCSQSQGCIANIGNMQNIVLTPTDVLRVSGTTVTSIGYGVRSFLRTFNLSSYLRNRVTNVVDRDKHLVIWSIVTDISSTPNTLLIYNYEEDRFATASSFQAGCVGSISGVGLPIAGAINSSLMLSSFTGAAVDSGIITAEEDMEDVYSVNRVIPSIENLDGSLSLTVLRRYNLSDTFSNTSSLMNTKGICNFRASGRYFKAQFSVSGEHDGFIGYTPTLIKRGKR